MNMFTKNVKSAKTSDKSAPRRRGRPPGPSGHGLAVREKLYETAVGLIGEQGYAETTLRQVAERAGVSVGLLYRYFPSKRAVVLALYDRLSQEQVARAAGMGPGLWRDRFLSALETSLEVLGPHRRTLSAMTAVLISSEPDGIFGAESAFSRRRVQGVFQDAVVGAKDAPRGELASALGRLLYLVHLAVILWWLLDRSPGQRATTALVGLTRQLLPMASMALKVKRVGALVLTGDRLFADALLLEEGEQPA
jgi:AcrR family transcriptional regulator